MSKLTYLDPSAIVKLAAVERETGALRRFVGRKQILVSSALARTEVMRALRPLGPAGISRGRATLQRLRLVAIDDLLLEAAGSLEPASLRTLDAIHLATVVAVGDDLDVLVTYDTRLRSAAELLGIALAAPGL